MRRGGLFPSAFLNTVFFLVTGTLKNGERCVDAASLGLQHLGQLQIDEPSDQERSNLLTGSQARGYPGYESGVHNMPGVVPGTNVDFQSASQLELSSGGDSSKTVEGSTHRTRPIQVDLTGDAGRHLLKPKQNSATNFRVEVTLGEEMKKGNRSIEDAMMRLKEALAELYPWQEENIEVVKINFKTRQVDLLFFDPAMGRANTITKHAHLLKDLQIAVPELKVQKVEICDKLTDRDGVTLAVYQAPFWMRDYFPYIMTGGCILIVVILSLTMYACLCRAKDNVPISSATNGLGSQHIYQQQQPQQQQHVLFPDVVAPDTGSPLAIQPCAAPVFVPVGYVTTPVPAQPIRVKRKGLLERRGSNASLTLDLQPSPEIGRWDGTPPKESSGLEYLMSAGNRLSRRDLRNAAKNTKILYEEFWEIPMNHPEKVSVAGSGMKNRYKTIIPNEHTRVVLPDADQDPLSSYINANYIRGYEGEMHAYVATQGPMAHTIEDFWQMVWHLCCPIIVMITKLKEKSKPKCENYLPEHYGIYGDIEVTVTKIIQKKGFVVRHLHLKYDGESRVLLHFWYTAWPDHKPPDSPSMLLELVKEVELRRYKTDGVTPRGPVVVHCSAGIGRTGCFVGISIGIRQLREEHSVDVLGIVCGMRLDRGGMIQTHEQYDFVHQALCEYERTLGEPSIQSLTALTSEGH